MPSFMDLPLEIRQSVYCFHLQFNDGISWLALRNYIDPFNRTTGRVRLPPLLFTSKVIRIEAFQPILNANMVELSFLEGSYGDPRESNIDQCQRLIDAHNLKFNFLHNLRVASVTLETTHTKMKSILHSVHRPLSRCTNLAHLVLRVSPQWLHLNSPNIPRMTFALAKHSTAKRVTIVWRTGNGVAPFDRWEERIEKQRRKIVAWLVRKGRSDMVVVVQRSKDAKRCVLEW